MFPNLHCSRVSNRKDSLSSQAKLNTEIFLVQFWESPEPVIYCVFMQLLEPDRTEPRGVYLRIEAEIKIIMSSICN